MTKRKLFFWFIFLFIMIMTSGCWNRRELNELAVTVAMGVDKKGDQILLSQQIVNPGAIASSKGGATAGAPVTLFQETGRTLQEAGRKMTTKATRKIYTGQLQILIIGEELAKEGVSEILDHVSRDHQYRRDFFVVIARGKAENILKIHTPIEQIPATKMQGSLETSANAWGTTSDITIEDFMSSVISKGKEAVLSGIGISGRTEGGKTKESVEKNDPDANLKFEGLAVFKKDKLLGWLNQEESKGYNYTQGEIQSTTVVLPCPQGNKKITVELLQTQEETQFKVENGRPKVEIKIRTEANVSDSQCDIDLTKSETMDQLENWTEKEIKQTILAAVKAAQKKFISDIFGFGNVVHRENPSYWDKVKKDWDKEFQDLQVVVDVKADIRRVFLTRKSFKQRMEE